MLAFLRSPRYRSIQANFLALNVPLVVLVVVALFALEETRGFLNAREKLKSRQIHLMASQTVILAEPVGQGDAGAVSRILATILTDRDFKGAAVYDADGQLMASYGDPVEPENEYTVSLPITHAGHGRLGKVGRIETQISLARLWQTLRERTLVATLMAALVAIAALLSSQVAFRRTIGEPMVRLMAALRKSEAGVPVEKVEWPADDEMGQLVAAFNDMLARRAAYEREITESKMHLEARVADRTRELAVARDAAESASRSKSRFLANMSHELRTPLNAIIGFSEIMAHKTFGPLGDKHYEGYVEDIRASGAHLLALINDILDLSKAEAGKLELNEEIFELEKALTAVRSLLGERALAKSITLDIGTAEGAPVLWADRRKIIQVLTNLLTNAIKATPKGGVVSLTARRSRADGLVVKVTDNGIGISPEDIPRVLEPFGQASGRAALTTEGTGLGLPLARNLVEMHGGEFRLESMPGIGTSVTFTLPAFRLRSEEATA